MRYSMSLLFQVQPISTIPIWGRVCCRVEQSTDSMGAAQIKIQAKNFFHGFLEKSFKIQSCQKPNKN